VRGVRAMPVQCCRGRGQHSNLADAIAGVTRVRGGAGRLPAARAGRGRGGRVAAPADAPGQAGRQGARRAGGRGLRSRRPRRRPARRAARAAAHAAQRPRGARMRQPGPGAGSHASERRGRVCGPPVEAAVPAGRERRQAGRGRREVGLRQAAAADGGGRGRGGQLRGERRGRSRQCRPGEACKAAAGALTAARATPGVPALQLSRGCGKRPYQAYDMPPSQARFSGLVVRRCLLVALLTSTALACSLVPALAKHGTLHAGSSGTVRQGTPGTSLAAKHRMTLLVELCAEPRCALISHERRICFTACRARQTTPPSGALRSALSPANSQTPAPALVAAAGGSKIPVRTTCFTYSRAVLRTQGLSAMRVSLGCIRWYKVNAQLEWCKV